MKNNATALRISASNFTKVTIFFSLLLAVNTVKAQTGFYVAPGANVFFAGDSASIYSNVINNGKVGVAANTVVNFQGKKWENTTSASINADNSSVVRFIAADSARQQLNGGYNAVTGQGASFATLQIENKAGVELVGTTTKVSNELKMAKGLVYLNNNMLVAGDKISGYDASKYIVTGTENGGSALIREGISSKDGQVVFPVGTTANAYTPAMITVKSEKENTIYVNVADSVRAAVVNGQNLAANSVNKTWQIGTVGADAVTADVTLQHIVANEGTQFAANRNSAYISTFSNNAWDTAYPQTAPVNGMNTRANVALNGSYFTKFTAQNNIVKTVVLLSANRIDTANASVYWTTKPEVNVKYFVVERMLATETSFSAIDSVTTKAINGFSKNTLNYNIDDKNNYTGNTTYRLKLVDFAGNVTYSNIVIINGKSGVYNMMMWPNPSTSHFFLSWNTRTPVKNIVIVNALGQIVRTIDVTDRTTTEVKGLSQGIYFVSFILTTGVNVETKKMIVAGI